MSERDPRGRFTRENRAARGRKAAGGGLAFARFCREALDDPNRKRRLLQRVDAELATLGPAPLTTAVLRYAYGEPALVVRHEVRALARRLAMDLGVEEAVLLEEAARLADLPQAEEEPS